MIKDDRERCSWATTDLYKEYHDKEWGNPGREKVQEMGNFLRC